MGFRSTEMQPKSTIYSLLKELQQEKMRLSNWWKKVISVGLPNEAFSWSSICMMDRDSWLKLPWTCCNNLWQFKLVHRRFDPPVSRQFKYPRDVCSIGSLKPLNLIEFWLDLDHHFILELWGDILIHVFNLFRALTHALTFKVDQTLTFKVLIVRSSVVLVLTWSL